MTELPAPIPVPFPLKPIESAETRLRVLDDGRLLLWIRHEVLRGVTPEMLVWWFQHLDSEFELEGMRYPSFRLVHPFDHVSLEYVERGPNNGTGSVLHVREVLGRNPDYAVDVLSDVLRLDEGGFSHQPRYHGLHLARVDATFTRVRGGTLVQNSMVVGASGVGARFVNNVMRDSIFDDAHGLAWLRHNVEEVGSLEYVLPQLFAKAHGRRRVA